MNLQVAPEMGFGIVRATWEESDLLDMSTKEAFLQIRKGLGPLIIPHFNQYGSMPLINPTGFPHIDILKKAGINHPFQHGLGRYVPWQWTRDDHTITGRLSGEHSVHGHRLIELTGFDFSAEVVHEVLRTGFKTSFRVEGAKPIAVGTHYYFDARDKSSSTVEIPKAFESGPRVLSLHTPLDSAFLLARRSMSSVVECVLRTVSGTMTVRFPSGGNPESSFDSFVVFSPEHGNYVCLEPISYRVGKVNEKVCFKSFIEFVLSE